MLLQTEGSKDKILDVQWSKRPEDLRFATVGLKELKFWHPSDVTRRLQQKGTFQKAATTATLCVAFDEDGWCYTGGENGLIQVWNEQCTVVKTIKAHAAAVSSINVEGNTLVSGSKDAKIAIMTISAGTFKLEKVVDLEAATLTVPKAIDFYKGNLLVGLRNGSIMEFKNILEAGAEEHGRTLMQSHFEGEVWGLTLMGDNKAVTCGDDNRVMVFNLESRQCEAIGKISDVKKPKCTRKSTASTMSQFLPNKQARCVAYSDKHNHLAVCSNFGKVSIRQADDIDKKLQSLKEPQEWCEVARYSPDQKYLAVGSHDDKIWVYEISDEGKYSLYCKFARHASFINSLDWSLDGKYIRSTDGGHERLFYSMETKHQDPHGVTTTADLEWASHSIKQGEAHIAGCKPHNVDNTHINYLARSPDGSLIVTADDYGLVNVFNYPVAEDAHGSGARSYAGHSEHVVRVEFSSDGQRMFTVGGQDKALIQWKRK